MKIIVSSKMLIFLTVLFFRISRNVSSEISFITDLICVCKEINSCRNISCPALKKCHDSLKMDGI